MARGAKTSDRIDWPSVRERMAAALRRTQEALEPPRGRTERILKARARALAAPPGAARSAGPAVEVVPFGLGGSAYLIESRYVLKAMRASPVAPVPRTPEFLRGITNIRGELLPVYDLSLFFGLTKASPTAATGLAVLGRQDAEFAVIVDWIEPAAAIARDALLTAEGGAHPGHKHVLGITGDGRALLDGEALLDEPDLFLTG